MSEFSVDVINKILELAEPHIQTVGEIEYSDKKLYPIDEDYRTEPIVTGTLSSLVSYIKDFSDVDGINFTDYMIHISSPRSVSIVSKMTRSAPAFSPAVTICLKQSYASSNESVPSGSISSPMGPTSRATRTFFLSDTLSAAAFAVFMLAVITSETSYPESSYL